MSPRSGLAGPPAPQLRSRRLPAGSGRSLSFSAVACSGGDWLILLVTMHFALCSLACRPFWVEEVVDALVVVSGSDMTMVFAPRAMFPTIAGVPQIQEQIVDVVLHSKGGDQQHRVTGRGIQYHRSWGNCGGDSETVHFPDKVIAMPVVLTKVQFPGRVVDTPVVFNDRGHGPEFPDQVQLLGKVVDTPVVYNDMESWSRVPGPGAVTRQGR